MTVERKSSRTIFECLGINHFFGKSIRAQENYSVSSSDRDKPIAFYVTWISLFQSAVDREKCKVAIYYGSLSLNVVRTASSLKI